MFKLNIVLRNVITVPKARVLRINGALLRRK